MEIIVSDLSGLEEAARRFLDAIGDHKVIAFDAPMGAGKTTFINALCRVLGVEDDVSSPTFSIVNEYTAANGDTIYHFDCYRLETTAEALDMGAELYLESGNLCLIEWPDTLEPLLPADTLRVRINTEGEVRSIIL